MSQQEYTHKHIYGTVISVEDRHLPSGKYVVTARIQDDKEKIWYCTLWDELAIAFMSNGLLQQKVYVDGGVKEENAVSVRFFNGQTAKPKEEKPVTSAEEFEPYDTLIDEGGDSIKVLHTDSRGVRTYCYKHKRNFVRVNGRWEDKMDYCLRVMGTSSVMSYLREFDGVTKGKLFAPNKYKEQLAFMLDMCRDHTGDILSYYEEENGHSGQEKQPTGASASF